MTNLLMDAVSIAQLITLGTIGLLVLSIAIVLRHARQNHRDARLR